MKIFKKLLQKKPSKEIAVRVNFNSKQVLFCVEKFKEIIFLEVISEVTLHKHYPIANQYLTCIKRGNFKDFVGTLIGDEC